MDRYDVEVFRSYPPVNVTAFSPVDERDEYTLISGRYHPDKRIETVLDHIANDDVVVAGAVADESYYRDLVESYPHVDFRRDLPEDEWITLHQRAGAYVFTNPEEHFGIAPAEAMSCGVPTVVPKGAGIAELIEDGENGWLAEADFSNLKTKVQDAKLSGEKLRRLSRQEIVDHCAPCALARDVKLAIELSKRTTRQVDKREIKQLSESIDFTTEELWDAIQEFGYR